MVARILSLLKSLKKTYRKSIYKCVSPLLMGAVLAIGVTQPLNVKADSGWFYRIDEKTNPVDGGTVNYSRYIYPDTIQIIEPPRSATGSFNPDYYLTYEYSIPIDVMRILSESGTYNGYFYCDFRIYYQEPSNTNTQYRLDYITVDGLDNYTLLKLDDNETYRLQVSLDNVFFKSDSPGYTFIENFNINIRAHKQLFGEEPDVLADTYRIKLCLENFRIYAGYMNFLSSDSDSVNIDNILNNQEQYRNEDRQDAEQSASDMTGFASQLDNLKNTWAILWYPIEFTNRFVEVFTGGTQAAAYQDEYTYVTGYRYNDETGFLEPIQSMTAQPQSAGTGITFPSFELMGYTVWDSYTYDLSQVKDQLPEVFDAIYVFVSILEMLWFVGFLRNKYNEVFG